MCGRNKKLSLWSSWLLIKNKSSYTVSNTASIKVKLVSSHLSLAYVFNIVHALLIHQTSPCIRIINHVKPIWPSQSHQAFYFWPQCSQKLCWSQFQTVISITLDHSTNVKNYIYSGFLNKLYLFNFAIWNLHFTLCSEICFQAFD